MKLMMKGFQMKNGATYCCFPHLCIFLWEEDLLIKIIGNGTRSVHEPVPMKPTEKSDLCYITSPNSGYQVHYYLSYTSTYTNTSLKQSFEWNSAEKTM
uniref:Uncharacterized protein n=1 Tax=Romanomermis culicivorax TaxID=13658 RepID=A0A915I5Y3_ROMCU